MNYFFGKTSNKQSATDKILSEFAVETLPFVIESASGMLRLDRHLTLISALRQDITCQLDLLRFTLQSSSVVLMWNMAQGRQLVPYAWSSHQEIVPTACDAAEGILGALKDRDEISLPSYRQGSPALPYAQITTGVGSFHAVALLVDGERIGILCCERKDSGEWSAQDRSMISRSLSLISSHYSRLKNYLYVDFERNALQQVFNGLQSLNSALDLESVYQAAVRAINCVVETDLIAVSRVVKKSHQFDFISTEEHAQLFERQFRLDDSIVGQVVKYGRTLPERSSVPNHAPIVNQLSEFDRYRSVLVVPLRQEDGQVSAVLVVAAMKAGQFPRSCREQVEMIAAQLAIKIGLARAHDQINAMTLTDPLTGIANRRAFQRALDSMHERAVRCRGAFSLILCDIDLFKRINDSYGHPFGDCVIQQLAKQLAEIVRSGDLAARVGGEEFAVLVEGSDGSASCDIAERLRINVEQMKLTNQDNTVAVTISIGIAAFPDDSSDKDQLIRCADQALYRAKREGRNRVVRWQG